jgi:hypothetical protein
MNAGSIFQRKLRLLLTVAFEGRSTRASRSQGPSQPSRCHSSRTYQKVGMDQYMMFGGLESGYRAPTKEGTVDLTSRLGTSSKSGIPPCNRSSWSRCRRPCFGIGDVMTTRSQWSGLPLTTMCEAKRPMMGLVMQWLCLAERI